MNRSRDVHTKSAERSFLEANRSVPFLALILRSPRPERGSIDPRAVFLCRSVDRRQANFGEQLLECRITVQADETLIIAKIQQDLVMRLEADGQVLERFALVPQPGVSLRHKIGRQLLLLVKPLLFQTLRFE